MNLDEEDKDQKEIVDAGTKFLVKAAGAIVGYSLGGLEGALSTAFIDSAIDIFKTDYSKRSISPWEERRVRKVLDGFRKKVQNRLDKGEPLRNDGFFKLSLSGHPACSEIPFEEQPPSIEAIEGILLAAQREHEEKKLLFLGNLLANIFFEPGIDISQINFLIKIGSTISFRQMCILSMFSEPYRSTMDGRYRADVTFPKPNDNLNSIFQEIINLGSQGLLYENDEPVTKPYFISRPCSINVIGAGSNLYKLMELSEINKAYLDAIVLDLFPNETKKFLEDFPEFRI